MNRKVRQARGTLAAFVHQHTRLSVNVNPRNRAGMAVCSRSPKPTPPEATMLDRFEATNELDDQGRPAGGTVRGVGLSIDWQKGPLREQGSDEPAEPNGAFVETVIAAAIQRIEHYQEGQFACDENAKALMHLRLALEACHRRTARRTSQGVEGTHQGS
jgi:hypothetical protein